MLKKESKQIEYFDVVLEKIVKKKYTSLIKFVLNVDNVYS